MEGRVKSRQQKLTGSRPPASSTGYSDQLCACSQSGEADMTPKAHTRAPRSLCPAVSRLPKPSRQLMDTHSTPLSVYEIKLVLSPPRPAPLLLPCFCLWLHSGSKSQRCLWCGALPGFQIECINSLLPRVINQCCLCSVPLPVPYLGPTLPYCLDCWESPTFPLSSGFSPLQSVFLTVTRFIFWRYSSTVLLSC